MLLTPPTIKLLPPFLIDQIKAGEVIERPSMLLKEIVENSIDAGANKIEIVIKGGGIDLIALTDNGHGMRFNDLPSAFTRHATSKISSFDDIYNLSSFGFRGEALASIASVSRVTCSSIADNLTGGRIIYHGGELVSHTELTGDKSGTAIFVKDLFYNTPARLKFTKSISVEKNSIKKIITHYLISYPQVEFTVQYDDLDPIRYERQGEEDYLKRVTDLFSNKKDSPRIFSFDKEYLGNRIQGFFTEETSSNKQQFIFANKRPINDKSLHGIIYHNFPSIGHYVILISTPKDEIDINVHPNKTQVKFSNSGIIYSLLSAGIKETLRSSTSPINFEDRTLEQTEFSYQDSSLAFQSKTNEFSEQSFSLPGNYAIYAQAETRYLVSTHLLLQSLLNKILAIHYSEEELVPLLVAPPLILKNCSDKVRLQKFIESKMEIDFLNDNVAILRSIPRFLMNLPYHQILQQFINGHDFQISLTGSNLSAIVTYLNTDELLEQKVITIITVEKLKRLFD